MNAARTLAAAVALVALCALPFVRAAAQAPPGQASPSKGVVLKGKAPVSNEILKVKLPRPQEADLPNGVHMMVIEDHRAPQVSMQMIIQGAGGLFDPADIVLNPTFPEAELARYKTRQKAQLVQVRSMPQVLAAVARKKIEARFGGWKKAGASVAPAPDPGSAGAGKVSLVDRPNSVQTSLVIGTQALNRTSPDYEVMTLANAIIGGGPTGRLFLNLREEKGWTYGAYSGLNAPRYRGDWSAQTEIKGDVTDKAVGEILGEVKRIRTEPVPDKEFMDQKRSLVASFALSLETPSAILSNYVTSRRFNLPADYWDKYPERLMAITKEQVQAAAVKYLDPARLQIVAVGDGSKIAEGLKQFGALEVYDPDGKRKTPQER